MVSKENDDRNLIILVLEHCDRFDAIRGRAMLITVA